LLYNSNYCLAQYKNDKLPYSPKNLFVMLRAEQRRLDYFSARGDKKMINRVKYDADMVANSTVNDFNDHFNYCTVYYFMDTNLEKVKNKQFEGVLFTTKDYTNKTYITSNDLHSYQIIYYGRFSNNQELSKNIKDTGNFWNYEPAGMGIVINDSVFNYLHYIGELNHYFVVGRPQRPNKYTYYSRKLDIEYRPFAEVLQNYFQKR